MLNIFRQQKILLFPNHWIELHLLNHQQKRMTFWNHIEFDGTKVPWEDLNIQFTAAQQDDENGATMAENNLNEQDALGWALTQPYGWNDVDVGSTPGPWLW